MDVSKVHDFKYWLDKITNDPDLLPEDAYGKKIPLDANPKPIYFKTFCNVHFNRVCGALGYKTYDNLMANQIYDELKKDGTEIPEEAAYQKALEGELVAAAWKNPDPDKHGHLSFVYPAKPMLFSGKWNCYCPQVASVDHTCPCGANYAFSEKPDYFLLTK